MLHGPHQDVRSRTDDRGGDGVLLAARLAGTAMVGCSRSSGFGFVWEDRIAIECEFTIAKTRRFCQCSGHIVPTSDVGLCAVLACPVAFSKAGSVFSRGSEMAMAQNYHPP